MVLVFGFAATPSGLWPTGMVAVTVMQPLAAWAVPRTEDAGAAAAVAGAASASPVMAAAMRIVARAVHLMMSCPFAWQWRASIPDRCARSGGLGLRLAARTCQQGGQIVVGCPLATIRRPWGRTSRSGRGKPVGDRKYAGQRRRCPGFRSLIPPSRGQPQIGRAHV